jgi:ABC-2 type transport system ATP-binding protein
MRAETHHNDIAETVIRTNDLTKVYDGRPVVNKVNLVVRPGEIYGFLGPNGAGKTTTIRMILGLLQPTSGTVELFGHDVRHSGSELRGRLGVAGEQPFLYDDMTALEYLTFFARLYGVKDGPRRVTTLLERLDLAPFGHLLAREFSQGMQKKLTLARALLHDPEVLILDEPVSGLDPYGIVQVRELLGEKRQAGQAILISSHILSEVERTADRVGIIHRGWLIMEDAVDAVINRLTPGTELEVELQSEVPGLTEILKRLASVREVHAENDLLTIAVEGDSDIRASVSHAIAAAGGVVIGMNTRRATLEEAFVRLTEGRLKQLGLVVGLESKERS